MPHRSLNEAQRDWLALALLPGIGSTHMIRLLAQFGRPRDVLSASEGALREVVGPALATRIRAWRESVDVAAQERLLREYDAQLITLEDAEYPPPLAEIYDPPLCLFVRGTLEERDLQGVALVGTRKPSPYGIQTAERLAADLAARGLCVVSGMAAGIDAAAHSGALDAGGRTIAVLGTGVDKVFPAENAPLMHRIIQQGAVVSQFPMGNTGSRGAFPYRNRIISGLTLGTVVVEAPPSSGALITARHAAEQGREVFAVPGNINNRNSRGPHALLREGAKLCESVEDLIAELPLDPAVVRIARPARSQAPVDPPVRRAQAATPAPAAKTTAPARQASSAPAKPPASPPLPPNLSPSERTVLEVLAPDGSFVDEIAMAGRLPVSETLTALTLLELKGLVRQFSGKRFAPR